MNSAVFRERRRRLRRELEQRGLDCAVLGSGWARPRNFAHNVFPFRAESHFLYFVGQHLEGAVLVTTPSEEVLYLSARDPDLDLWAGPAPTFEQLESELGIEVRALDDLEANPSAACIPPQDDETAFWLADLLDRDVVAQSGPELEGADAELAEALVSLRLVHDEHAISELRRAAHVSALAHRAGMRATRSASHEFVVRGEMEGVILRHGMIPSYTSIVSVRGEILHNAESFGALAPGQLLLADVGAETNEGWAGDITRTWPTSGKFSATQREIYDVVLAVQESAIAGLRPGVSYSALHRAAGVEFAEHFVALGLLRGDPVDLYQRGVVAVFFPHGLGHLLGLDVHDMEDLGDRAGYGPGRGRSTLPGESALRLDRVLEAGQLVTIEPGFYRSPLLIERARRDPAIADAVDWARFEAFSDVRGIRIEDDVLVTPTGADVLSFEVPKARADMESLILAG